jgi:hypothetical protein
MSFLQISHAEDLENLIDVDSVQQTHKINLLENLLCCLIWWQKSKNKYPIPISCALILVRIRA